MSALRPLPPRPSLEFERKEAKALLRRLRAGDPEAIERARARHPIIDFSAPERIRLADAQLVIAREYGFTSWPRLVRYFRALERQDSSRYSIQSNRRDLYDASVRSLLAQHRERQAGAGHALASYVPRLYGMRMDEVFATAITEAEACLAVARMHGFPSWQVLLERTAEEGRRQPDGWEVDPMRAAAKAMAAGDLDALKHVVDEHPDLLHPSSYDEAHGRTLLNVALGQEEKVGLTVMRPIVEWLVAQGLDLQHELNLRLCGHIHMQTETVRRLLGRGADPNWVAPNGIPVLEHALIRYWNGGAVDLVAERAKPRQALWISAGLGDVDGVRAALDGQGRPTPEARRLRPDFDAVGPGGVPSHPEPGDEEILLEAFFVAMLNGRSAVLEYMVSRGFNVNSLVWGTPVTNIAVGNAMVPMVECLVRCGADLDLRGQRPNKSAREIARDALEHVSGDAERHRAARRVAELCGLDPDAILAERDARPPAPPTINEKVQEALELAGDDAFRRGQSEIGPENLLFGVLRLGGLGLLYFGQVSRMDFERFRADVADRVRHGTERVERPKLTLDADAQAAIQSAIAFATARRRSTMHGLHVLYALIQSEQGPVAELLTRYGSSAAALKAELERAV
jgi:hypothetical protein